MNTLTAIADALYAACHRDLPDIRYVKYLPQDFRRFIGGLAFEDAREFEGKLEQIKDVEEKLNFLIANSVSSTIQCRRPRKDECEIISFPQTWGSTALGYGGVGGAAMTRAQTVVVSCPLNRSAVVYFGGDRLAYRLSENEMDSKAFAKAMIDQWMPNCAEASVLGWETPYAD